MPGRTVVILGAGATKACGGLLTSEILPEALAQIRRLERGDYLRRVERFLVKNFSLPPRSRRRPSDFPPLPLVLSIVDMAIDRGDSFGPDWEPNELRRVRKSLEYTVFAVLDHRLHSVEPHYLSFLSALYATQPESVTLISLNYDIIADNALAEVADEQGMVALPDYGCDISAETYQAIPKFGALLKLHGSLNWLYCPNCHRLDIGVAESRRGTVKVLEELYVEYAGLDRQYTEGSPCVECGTWLVPVLITPTHLKDYRNSHIARVWYEAERALRVADRAIFIGYSLPDDDVEVVYLLKRALAKLAKNDPGRITVVERALGRRGTSLEEHPVGRRYRALLGDRIEWRTDGFEAWIDDAAGKGFEPARSGRRRRVKSPPAPMT